MHGTRCLTTLIVVERTQGYKTLGVISRSMARGADIEITFATSRLTAKESSRAKLSIFKILGSIVRTYVFRRLPLIGNTTLPIIPKLYAQNSVQIELQGADIF
ncbi:hypothetical protein TWF132_002528 [Orbilia oligospora]|nr:hypothetical protein TWF132_002528 [Orbilia oligospora]